MSLEPRPGTGPPSLRSGALTSNSPAASLSRQSEKNLPLHVRAPRWGPKQGLRQRGAENRTVGDTATRAKFISR